MTEEIDSHGYKYCPACQLDKLVVSDFDIKELQPNNTWRINPDRINHKYRTYCNDCNSLRKKVYSKRKSNRNKRDRIRHHQNSHIKKTYWWLKVLHEAKYSCVYCGKDGKLTIDHVIPLSLIFNQANDLRIPPKGNVVPACEQCNILRSSMSLEIFARQNGVCFDPKRVKEIAKVALIK